MECDVADEDSVKRAMDEVVVKFGRIDVLVASAGEYGWIQLFCIPIPDDFSKSLGICENYAALEFRAKCLA